MTEAEAGLLMLTCRLSDPSVEPLNLWQYHAAAELVSSASKGRQPEELHEKDLLDMGFAPEFASRISALLHRKADLDGYLQRCEKNGITIITRLSPRFPERLEKRLKETTPAVLFCKGNPALLFEPCISLVGSRDLHEDGEKFARKIGTLCAKEGYTLVSGDAVGADSVAQEACLSAGGCVISFIPGSLLRCKNTPNHLYISEDGVEEKFSAQRALARNRLIHAAGERVFVAQCGFQKGGTWRGTMENLRFGYCPVYVHRDGSSGAIGLERAGAVGVNFPDSVVNCFD